MKSSNINHKDSPYIQNEPNKKEYTTCSNCRKKFYDETQLIQHYQICFNARDFNQNINEVINIISNNQVISNLANSESNPFIPDNLNEYIDWEIHKNENTGINMWIQKEILKPEGK